MKREQAIQKVQRNAGVLQAMGVTALYLFGSTVHDRAAEESDLDIFIDYDRSRRFSLVDLVGVKQFLEEDMAIKIDITTRDSLHPMLKDEIERSAIRVF